MNYILVHGMEINMPHWEVLTSWPYCCEELLLGLIAKGNKTYYPNAKLIKSKFLTKNTKMKIYKMMIGPVVNVLIRDLDINSKR